MTTTAAALCSTRHLRDLLVTMMERARDVMDAEASSVMLVDEPSGTLRWKVAVGDKVTALETLSVPIGEGIELSSLWLATVISLVAAVIVFRTV